MANSSNTFLEFNKTIKLNDENRNNLKLKRDDLRNRISGGYDIVKNVDKLKYGIEFHSQGSFVMDTIINPISGEDQYDLDDGVYFFGDLPIEKRPVPSTFHNWIIRSIESGISNNDIKEIKDKNTCVRVIYHSVNAFSYHVDLPAYYVMNNSEPDLADKSKGWYLSNPIEFIIWFESKTQSGFKAKFLLESQLYDDDYETWLNDIRKTDHQLRRIVRYLKAWGDYIKADMPPGVALTIMAGENYVPNDRDDLSFRDTLIAIKKWLLANDGKCPRPTVPVGQDLFETYSTEKKKFFMEKLDDLIQAGSEAIKSPNQKEACLYWQKHFGSRFSCDNVSDKKDYTALAAGAGKSDMWSTNLI